ncbi:MBL fold metallo-hydrolase [Halomonas sp. V046]|uniref:MBL fold metallo-hydrolase n=1 Tax=Halomonas sp. V046 TaxID=3459611 RepID=UPI00404463FB
MHKTLVLGFSLVICSLLSSPFVCNQAMAQESTPSVSFITLGTGGGPVIRQQRMEPANAVLIDGKAYLFDTGSGTERQMVKAGISMTDVEAIFLSHHHIDHNADLGQLISSRWLFNHSRPLPIIGPHGTVDMVNHLVQAFHPTAMAPIGKTSPEQTVKLADTVSASDLPMEMNTATEVYRDDRIRVLAITNDHYHFPEHSAEAEYARSYAFRIETPERSYVYTGDTGPSENVIALAEGADVLVSEVIDLERMEHVLRSAGDLPAQALPAMLQHMQQNHLTPEEVGNIAVAANVGEVVLTHIVPGMDNETGLDSYTNGVSNVFDGPVSLARDLDCY